MVSRRLFVLGLGSVAAASILSPSLPSPGRGGEEDDVLAIDPRMEGRTRGFALQCDRSPWVEETGRTCGRVITYRAGVEGRGSCVLLDRFGTVALTTHQVEDWLSSDGTRTVEAVVRFSPRPGEIVETKGLSDIRLHEGLDLAFASIDPAFVASADLMPVVWGAIPNVVVETEIVAVGWALGRDRLHAAQGVCRRFHDIDEQRYTSLGKSGSSGRFFCKIEARLGAYPGMSGGAVFSGGALVGIDNANSPADDIPDLRFTPSWAVWDGYRKLYPDRAAEAVFAPGLRLDRQPMPLSCVADPRAFSR
ncbi:S1 family peptidase [Magnetospirillum molischianum]|uniref:Serine protease n=1 Tax=Magnetospirillum molischianum DSM 120 TaxID=1150626 RepID=H8FPV6_MAGML|nr:serine protease [Magnetospirillum molischianum]CCG40394.1 exported hypothetical protein [Magnetospirillum molischianum DSM 120]